MVAGGRTTRRWVEIQPSIKSLPPARSRPEGRSGHRSAVRHRPRLARSSHLRPVPGTLSHVGTPPGDFIRLRRSGSYSVPFASASRGFGVLEPRYFDESGVPPDWKPGSRQVAFVVAHCGDMQIRLRQGRLNNRSRGRACKHLANIRSRGPSHDTFLCLPAVDRWGAQGSRRDRVTTRGSPCLQDTSQTSRTCSGGT